MQLKLAHPGPQIFVWIWWDFRYFKTYSEALLFIDCLKKNGDIIYKYLYPQIYKGDMSDCVMMELIFKILNSILIKHGILNDKKLRLILNYSGKVWLRWISNEINDESTVLKRMWSSNQNASNKLLKITDF